MVIAIADHQTLAVFVDLVNELFNVGSDLGGQRRREHLPGAVADNLIKQRPRRISVLVGRTGIVN